MKRAEDDLFYRGHIMNAFLDCLYNFYKEVKTAKEIYDALEFKFKVQEEDVQRRTKKNGNYYNSGKKGHYAKECRSKEHKTSANMVEEALVAMVTKINMADTSSGWWFDSGAMVHVCKDRLLFKTYEKLDRQEIQIGTHNRA
ncbi:unnamed protein product [Camellia sinensis]